eukprot:6022838-Pleurochrysis_carterae.AAC.1
MHELTKPRPACTSATRAQGGGEIKNDMVQKIATRDRLDIATRDRLEIASGARLEMVSRSRRDALQIAGRVARLARAGRGWPC